MGGKGEQMKASQVIQSPSSAFSLPVFLELYYYKCHALH